MEEPVRAGRQPKASDLQHVDQVGPQVEAVPQKDRWSEGTAAEPLCGPETCAAPLRPVRRKYPEEERRSDTFVGEQKTSPEEKEEAGNVQISADVVPLPRPKRRNSLLPLEPPHEALPSKGVDRATHVTTKSSAAQHEGKVLITSTSNVNDAPERGERGHASGALEPPPYFEDLCPTASEHISLHPVGIKDELSPRLLGDTSGQQLKLSEETSFTQKLVEKDRSTPHQASSHRVPPSTNESDSVASGTLHCDQTSVPIIKRIGCPRGSRSPRRSPSRATKSYNGNPDATKSECSLHLAAGCQASVAKEDPPRLLLRTNRVDSGGHIEDSSKKVELSLPVPKPRLKKRLSGSFPESFTVCGSPSPSGSAGSEQNGQSGLPVPLPRTKKRLSGTFSDSVPPLEGSLHQEDTAVQERTGGSGVTPEGPVTPGEHEVPSEVEKQVLAAMKEEFPGRDCVKDVEKVVDEVSEGWTMTGEEQVPGTGGGGGPAPTAALVQDDWLHVERGNHYEWKTDLKEDDLDFGFVSVDVAAGSVTAQR